MTQSIFADRRVIFLFSAFVALSGAAFSYVVLDPTVGFDDANITQAYARHIAEGHGYVYNIAGERVEGSTSILWTGINVATFVVMARPEPLLAFICWALTVLTIYCAARTAQVLDSAQSAVLPLATAAGFLIFPGFFGWSVWSLMDTGLWICLVAALFLMVLRFGAGDTAAAPALCLIAAALPITRPEGIALTTGVALIYLLHGMITRDGGWRVAAMIGISGAVSAVAATLWRLSFFGYPVPNTFYAKTSSDVVGQVVSGIKYMLSYLAVSHNVLLVVLLCLAGVLILRHGTKTTRAAVVIIGGTVAGAAMIYTVLGGDHFGSHRFMLPVIPLALPVIMVSLRVMLEAGPTKTGWVAPVLLALPFVLVGSVSLRDFVHDNGDIAHEFRIAEDGRMIGDILNTFPAAPVVGVVAAGGTRMTYQGPMQDLMGLNWTVMAHAEPDALIADIKNHTGFNTQVFWDQPPDIFVPRPLQCPNSWTPLRYFLDEVTDYVSQSSEFAQIYATACAQGIVFHVLKSYLQQLEDAGTPLPFDVLPQP